MARQYSKSKKGGIRLYGFDEFIEALQKAENIDVNAAAEKCFNQCADIIVNALDSKMQECSVPESLQNKTQKFRVIEGNHYMFSYGWNRNDEKTFNSVCFLNYGTPQRYTKTGGQKVRINGKWYTLGVDRGKIEARGFISNAKRSAAQKMKKVQKDALKEMLGGLAE